MDFLKKLESEHIGDLYSAYIELFSVYIEKKDFDIAKKCLNKIFKYFDVYSAVLKGEENFIRISYIKKELAKVKVLAEKEIGIKDFAPENNGLDSIEKIIEQDKSLDEIFKEVAGGLSAIGADSSAINFIKHAISENKTDYKNYILLGDYYNSAEKYEEAIKSYEEYISRCPDAENPQVYNSLGVLHSLAKKYNNLELQKNYFIKAIELSPNYQDAIRNLAITYRELGEHDKCLEYYEQVLNLNPSKDDYFSYGCEKLRLGDFEKGLELFEYRFTKETDPNPYPEMPKPRWNPSIDLSDKTLLVQCEQGYGDSIQFGRCLKLLKAKKIILRIHDRLVDLFKINFPDIEVVEKSTPLEDLSFDYHVPLISLLYLFKIKFESIPFQGGYLKADSKLVEKYKDKYFNNDNFKIGISWRGGVLGNQYRNMPLKDLYCLASLPNVKLYSLQNIPRNDLQRAKADGIDITDVGSVFEAFSDTAAAISNLDLVISVDNVITNLAGAMGKKAFLLLNKISDWRWFLDEHKTPWYNSVEIFKKQNEADTWTSTVNKMIPEIEKFIK